GHEGKDQGEPGDPDRASYGEQRAELMKAERNKRQVDCRKKRWKRNPCRLRRKHRYAGYAAVDEVARQQKSFDAHRGGKDPRSHEEHVQEFTSHPHVARGQCRKCLRPVNTMASPRSS